MESLFKLKYFFNIVKSSDSHITYTLKKPSQMLLTNIHKNWLQYIYTKTHKQMPVYLSKCYEKMEPTPPVFGALEQHLEDNDNKRLLEYSLSDNSTFNKLQLQFHLVVPQHDAMQYFIKWQRYRKYWWSSISTTPSLFAVNDIKYEEKLANVNIVAQLPSGIQPVETVAINFEENDKSARLSCSMSLENALHIFLLDGLNNNSKEEYLRLHRSIAPYKISFALDIKDTEKTDTLKELASLLHYKLECNQISSWLPNFSLPYESQVKENLHLGVTYTAVLSEDTLRNGIFRFMNSSTMLGEQVHVADFHKYAAVVFPN